MTTKLSHVTWPNGDGLSFFLAGFQKKCPPKWFSRPFDEARLLVTAQNLLPKRPNAPFYVLVHCTISSCQRGGSFWQILLWCKLCHTKRSTSPSCCRDLRSNLRSF